MKRQIELTSKIILVLIAAVAFSAIAIPSYAIKIMSSDIIDGEVKTNDIATGAVTNSKIADNAVTSAKIKDGEVKAADIDDSAVGIERFIRGTETQSVSPGSTAIINAYCEPGEMSIGATFHSLVVGAKLLIVQYEPVSSDATGERIHGWHTTVENIGTESANFNSRAICIKVTS